MVTFGELSDEERKIVISQGISFYTKHTEHVDGLVKYGEDRPEVAPSGSDLFRPELWKSIHWNWFNTQMSLANLKKGIDEKSKHRSGKDSH